MLPELGTDFIDKCIKPVGRRFGLDFGRIRDDGLEGIENCRARGTNGVAVERYVPVMFCLTITLVSSPRIDNNDKHR